ncbi:pyrroloquinoline quinone biosynthesis protein PqqE [Lysobacter sp. K5869]|uniref:pyrroloquinoline quinone biosynthesis protein PqqE n=1 Tax=Lysobacter sp. K5869 TaxID=2820808 RepID=UPI001C05EFA0|nr:pyrroloquinoline quinone biosynthesis protein PqqE [Lysobacter sp. K5869]QWP78919.1 pyrroloquinoline quinone biosynthesis protein PqqE [Lysobacter sp. K5869]
MNARPADAFAAPAPPLAVLLELTHRCPLACPYCSNPLQLVGLRQELDTAQWRRVLEQAADLGVLQAHFSGGEPTLRKDLAELLRHARAHGLYCNLITSGVGLSRERLIELLDAGLDHLQLSLQDSRAAGADRIAGYQGAHARKLELARWCAELELPLTLNAVIHRHNAERVGEMIELALELGAGRLEVAHTQYYGWGLKNRAALLPTREQFDAVTAVVEAARVRLRGRLTIDYVTPDYYARRPKPCMGGWAQRFLNVTPEGKVLPCHAAETIEGLRFDSVLERGLDEIWRDSEAFNRYRGTAWMPEPCRGCEHRERDWGGCRCQALALSGRADTLDPVCEKSPDHAGLRALVESESRAEAPEFVYRRIRPGGSASG